MQEVRVITPQAPGGPVTVVRVSGAPPRTARELEGLIRKRAELGDQVNALSRRRNALTEEMTVTGVGGRAAVQERIAAVDERMARLESQIDAINDQVANAPAIAMTATTAPPTALFATRAAENLIPLVAIVSVFVLAPLAIAFARLIWKRSTAPVRELPADRAILQRLEQLQGSVDTMAVEIERISEGQRYAAKQLTDRERAALPR